MEYELKIKDENIPAHLDIEKEIAIRKTGQMTFTLRIDKGKISDLSVVEYVNVHDYLRLRSVVIEELTTSFTINSRDKQDALRHDNG